MRYLFNAWERVSKRLLQKKFILLCTDFDGTITPIKPRPKDAHLNKEDFLLLRKLAQEKTFLVAIISGRGLRDLKQKLPSEDLLFVANHGLEIADKKKHFIYPQAKRFIPTIARIAQNLKKRLQPFPEAILEEKRLTLSLHYRLVPKKKLSRLKKIFFQAAKPDLAGRKIKLTYGKKVWEVRPSIAWDKGRAVLWLAQRLKSKCPLAVYLGDDLTDEDGFRAVNQIGGLSVRVGRKKSSQAKYYLRGIKDTHKFLAEILNLKTKCKK